MSDTKQARANARRDQIVNAARLCFRRSGFHGAGMAEIAKCAALSVGQIYRCFENKDAIIEEIVRRIVSTRLQLMALSDDCHDYADAMAQRIAQLHLSEDGSADDDDHALILEASAEATRNPRVAEIMREADARLFSQACDIMRRRYPSLSAPQVAARVEFMAALTEGSAIRAFIRSDATTEQLYRLYHSLFQYVFSISDNQE